MKSYCFCLAVLTGFWAGKSYSQTEITRWQDGKTGAVSLTYDDGYINQFRYALPVMKKLKLPATFYVITGSIAGSKYPGKFIGRPVEQIVAETASIPTNTENYFERASAAKYLGYTGTFAWYDKSAILYEDDKLDEAFKVIDTLYAKVRSNEFPRGVELSMEMAGEKGLTWDSIRVYASQGYEFASHTVTHTHLAVLDSANIAYELEKSRTEIKEQLGTKYIFDAEIPFGIEHPRAMKFALPAYAALRNMMTDPYLQEINRGYKTQPGSAGREYVQWQRGATTQTSLPLMKSWIDTTLAHHNVWLVLVFHGVDGMGYEPLRHELLDAYFQYIKQHEQDLWIATFMDVAKYMRERMGTSFKASSAADHLTVEVSTTLDLSIYNLPLSFKTYIPAQWREVTVIQGKMTQRSVPLHDAGGRYIIYRVNPSGGDVKISPR